MSGSTPCRPRPTHFSVLLLISFAVFNLGFVIDATCRWSDHFEGLLNGVFHILFSGVVWCVYLIPWSLLVFALYRWKKWQRFRSCWVLAPAVLPLVVSVGSLAANPPTPSNRFRQFAKVELPAEVRNLHFHFSGGGITDYSDSYYFESSPREVDRLVSEMKLKKQEPPRHGEVPGSPVSTLPGCPDILEPAKFQRDDPESGSWFYHLITDPSKTQVYVRIGCY